MTGSRDDKRADSHMDHDGAGHDAIGHGVNNHRTGDHSTRHHAGDAHQGHADAGHIGGWSHAADMAQAAPHSDDDQHDDAGRAAYGVRHAAIIMDGNGRWAKKRHLPRVMGHRAGVEAVRKTVRAAGDLGLKALTLYAFSSENWKRPEEEVSDLMGLLRHYIRNDIDELARNNVRLQVIGNYQALAPDIVTMVDDALARTAKNDGTMLAVALNYGGQDEIVRAARAVAAKVAGGMVAADAISAEHISAQMDTASMPPLDLIIRTSGERRLSNFLLWQSAYAELYFTDTLWPDFNGEHLKRALDDFRSRDRRFGGR